MNYVSPQLEAAAASNRSEAEIRDIRARRNLMEANMRAEGTPEKVIERLATDESASRMLAYERKVMGTISSLFGGR